VVVHKGARVMMRLGRERRLICAAGLQAGTALLTHRRLVLVWASMVDARREAADSAAGASAGTSCRRLRH
jgi:hypothetical protein